MIVKISGREVLIKKNTKSIENAVEERSTAKFIVIDYDGIEYRKGQNVEIYDEGKLVFSGVIEKPVRKKDSADNIYYHTITCVDWHYLADKRIVRGGYANKTAGAIVRDIIENYLSEEGISEGFIYNGPIVAQAQFNYISAAKAIDSLAEKAGVWWRIGPDKKLYFVKRSTYEAPFAIKQSDCIKGSISVDDSNTQYRNKQYVIGGVGVTDPITENKKGDGEARSWTVGFPIAKIPTLKLNSTPVTVGIKGLEEGKQFYWSKGDSVIYQDDNEPVLAETDILQIVYQGQYPMVAIVRNTLEIDEYKAIEGGSGIIEAVDTIPKSSDSETAFSTAQQKLDKYGVRSHKVKFRITKTGLEVGQLITVNFPDYNIVGEQMLIEAIEITEDDGIVFYTVTAVAGPTMNTWAKFFSAIVANNVDLIIRENISENEVVVLLEEFYKTWLETEIPNIFRVVRPHVGLKPGFKPMFDPKDRVNYVAWFNGDTELGRKRIIKQTGIDTDEIVSTALLGTNDANETITHIGWVGGIHASDETDTGILVDKQAYSHTKTYLEALQIVKTDTKGW